MVSSRAGVSFFNCTFRNSGSDSAVLDGSAIRLDNCTIKTAGCAGVVLSGGDRNTLRRSENVISNSSIYHFSLRKRTYTPGLSWNGVGHTLRTSTIRDAPHSGVCVISDWALCFMLATCSRSTLSVASTDSSIPNTLLTGLVKRAMTAYLSGTSLNG